MGESRDQDDPAADWRSMVDFAGGRDHLAHLADRLRSAGPPPAVGGRDRSPVVIDTDIGGDPDDAVALCVAARTLPELALVVTGDEFGGQRARFARHLLDLLGRDDVTVVAGADLGNTRYFCVDGLVPEHVPEQPTDVETAVRAVLDRTPGTVRWVGMGPLSNLHHLLDREPGLAGRLRVTQMGGALNYRDPSRAEHNFRLDPDAARHVLDALDEIELVTSDVTFTDRIAIDDESPLYRALAENEGQNWARLLRAHLDNWFERFHPASIQHDALALSVAMELPFVGLTRTRVALDEKARMRQDPDGRPIWMSTRASYTDIISWLGSSVTGPGVRAVEKERC